MFGECGDRFPGSSPGQMYRGEAKETGIDGSAPGNPGWNCDAVGVSGWRRRPWVEPEGGLCQGESGSGASLGAIIASLTERFGVQR